MRVSSGFILFTNFNHRRGGSAVFPTKRVHTVEIVSSGLTTFDWKNWQGKRKYSTTLSKMKSAERDQDPSVISDEISGSKGMRLIWHRRDLRLHDNPLYSSLDEKSTKDDDGNIDDVCNGITNSLSVYIFDDKHFTPRPSTCNPKKWNAVTTGPHAARLLIEAVTELRQSIRSRGGELLVRHGDPIQILPDLARQIGATEIRWCEEPGVHEENISEKVRECFIMSADLSDVKIVTDVGYTLYHPDDLPRKAEEWAQLAHPKQKYSQKKKKKKKKAKRSSSPSPTRQNQSKANFEEEEYYDDFYSSMLKHSIVDVSAERFKGIPRIMGDYRRAARTHTSVRQCHPTPKRLVQPSSTTMKNVEIGDVLTLEELTKPLLDDNNRQRPILGMSRDTIELVVKAALARSRTDTDPSSKEQKVQDDAVRGGETHALQRLEHFVGNGHAVVADRSLADVSGDNSSKFSAHLALGTISPRRIYVTAQDAGEGCKWLISHLEMRDFFLYNAFASGSKLFDKDGMPVAKKKEKLVWYDPTQSEDTLEKWNKWATGETGLPLVDAGQIELMATGYCSNRVRQNMASVLTKDLLIDWRAGAEWFQFCLEDHCVGANWGNWAYFSGVGSDPKSRHFRTVSQAMRYDPKGVYVRKWIPRLQEIMDNGDEDNEAVFRPWDLIDNWPSPMVDPKTQYTWQDMQQLKYQVMKNKKIHNT